MRLLVVSRHHLSITQLGHTALCSSGLAIAASTNDLQYSGHLAGHADADGTHCHAQLVTDKWICVHQCSHVVRFVTSPLHGT